MDGDESYVESALSLETDAAARSAAGEVAEGARRCVEDHVPEDAFSGGVAVGLCARCDGAGQPAAADAGAAEWRLRLSGSLCVWKVYRLAGLVKLAWLCNLGLGLAESPDPGAVFR